MRQKSRPDKAPAEDAIKDIRRATRRHFSAEDKIRIVLEGLRGDDSISELCRREGIASRCTTAGRRSSWRRAEARWPATPPRRVVRRSEGPAARDEALKELVADLTLENRLLKKSMLGDGGDQE